MEPHPYGWLSILPPIAAILLAIATRRVIPSLLLGLFVGALVTKHGDPFPAVIDLLEIHLWRTIAQDGKLRTFCFTLLMGAMVGVINANGGMRGLVTAISPWANSRERAQIVTWFLGLLVFFDDYANTLLLGSTLRPLCDRLRISREKLAYLVDSTAAPVAGLALVSTWVAVEIDYVREGIQNMAVPADWNAFELFLSSIPYRFYVWLTLLFIPLLVWSRRDFGPMLSAERNRLAGDAPVDPVPAATAGPRDRWYNAVAPIVLTLCMVLGLIVVTGRSQLAATGQLDTAMARDVFGAGDATLALQYGALAGLVLAAMLALGQRILTGHQIIQAAQVGAAVVLPAIAILWIASALSRMTGNKDAVDGHASTQPYQYQDHRLYTGEFLQSVLVGNSTRPTDERATLAPPTRTGWWLPTLTFVLSAAVAFCTGTSWGTMGIVMPMTIPLVQAVFQADGMDIDATHPILVGSVGGVLSGAIFGDHCSPISDTTVLSSQSSGCDHIAHVWTQLPYALTIAGISIVVGTLPIGLGVPWWSLLPIQLIVMLAVIWGVGTRLEPSEFPVAHEDPL